MLGLTNDMLKEKKYNVKEIIEEELDFASIHTEFKTEGKSITWHSPEECYYCIFNKIY